MGALDCLCHGFDQSFANTVIFLLDVFDNTGCQVGNKKQKVKPYKEPSMQMSPILRRRKEKARHYTATAAGSKEKGAFFFQNF